MTRYIGIDPGLSCGLSVFDGATHAYAVQGVYRDVAARLLDTLDVCGDDFCTHGIRTYVAVEKFIIGGAGTRRTHQPDAPIVIGKFTELASRYGGVSVELQAPADAKRLMPRAHLRRLGVWSTPTQVNQRDADDANMATRHALLCLLRHDAALFQQMLQAVSLM